MVLRRLTEKSLLPSYQKRFVHHFREYDAGSDTPCRFVVKMPFDCGWRKVNDFIFSPSQEIEQLPIHIFYIDI